MIIQLPGEGRWEAIVNHFSLDVLEECEFLNYINQMGYTMDSDDEVIENLHKMWDENINQ